MSPNVLFVSLCDLTLAPVRSLLAVPRPPPFLGHDKSHPLVSIVAEERGQLTILEVRIISAFGLVLAPHFLIKLVDLIID